MGVFLTMTIIEKTSEKFDDLTVQTGNTGIAFAAIFTDDNKKYLSTDLMYETNRFCGSLGIRGRADWDAGNPVNIPAACKKTSNYSERLAGSFFICSRERLAPAPPEISR